MGVLITARVHIFCKQNYDEGSKGHSKPLAGPVQSPGTV